MNAQENKAKEQENAQEAVTKEQADEAARNIEKRTAEAQLAMLEGKGVLELLQPIRAAGQDVIKLVYDFTRLTGMEYAEAMDSDPQADQVFRITNRQALALFAAAAAKDTPHVDKKDILERIGVADAMKGAQLATLFFVTSTRSGNLRISRE